MSPSHPRQLVLQELLSQLQAQITEFQTLLPLLCLPLARVNLLPPQFRRFNSLPSKDVVVDVARVFPPIQRVLLESILPTWETVLEEEGCSALILQYFCPDAFSDASPAGNVALCAYSTILSLPLRNRSVDFLSRLAKEYPIDRLFHAVSTIHDPARRSVSWDDCLRDIFAVPVKIANAFKGQDIAADLCLPDYHNNLCIRTEFLIHALSKHPVADLDLDLSLVTQLFSKLVHVGAFPSSAHPSPSQSSFFHSALPSLRGRLRDKESKSYQSLWNRTIASLPSVLTQQAVFASLFSSLTLESTLGVSTRDRGIVRREAALLYDIVGDIGVHDDLWNSLISVILTRTWGENHSRVFVCWLASGTQSSQAQEAFLSRLVGIWSVSEHIKHSLLSRHQFISTLLLLVVSHFPQHSNEVTSVALSPSLVSAVGAYITHPDASVRRCGMLVAEVVASRAGKNLNFDDWEGDDDGRVWARRVRQLCSQRDIDFEPFHEDDTIRGNDGEPGDLTTGVTLMTATRQGSVAGTGIPARGIVDYDSDDSLTGYASPSHSRTPSPTPSELQEIEKDPTLHTGRKKIPRPVYLAQLGELVRNSGVASSEEDQEADKIEIAMNIGEELIRRKRDYGTELLENAANLVYGFISLNNKFDLDDFDDKRQGIAIALVTCCPKISAQCMIEEFFKNQYSSTQRSVMLNALALGARELASLPINSQASQPLATQRTTFPSKMLPSVLHRKYLAAGSDAALQPLLEDITKAAVDKSQEVTADKVPKVVRERQLRIRKPSKITEVVSASHKTSVPSVQRPPSAISFTNIAAEWFIMPFVNRFWVFLRDEQTREERTAQRDVLYQYRGAGTGLILNSLILSAFLNTMAILVHASQNAPQWLAVIAPNTLELAVTVGSRQITRPVSEDSDDEDGSPKGSERKEASVLTSALNLVLIILDGCIELDGGHSLGLEHTALLIGAGEWAGQVFNLLERGIQVTGIGGIHEVELRRATAGVLLKVDQITSKWRRSMVDVSYGTN